MTPTTGRMRSLGKSFREFIVVSRRFLRILVVVAVLLPIALCVVAGTGQLLAGLGDEWGAVALGRLSLALGIGWVLNLVFLLLALGLEHAAHPDDPADNS